jgi:hypothetical protein
MRSSQMLVLVAMTILLTAASARRSAAMVIYPWCAEYGGRSFGGENCGFVTFKQCLATIAGNGGFCVHAVSAASERRAADTTVK